MTKFVCSLSPLAKRAIQETGGMNDAIVNHIKDCVQQIAGNESIAASLKVPVPGHKTLRQIDIKIGPNTPVILKNFVFWDAKNDRWHCLTELGIENYWEEKHSEVNPECN